jgi:hypothetical protein
MPQYYYCDQINENARVKCSWDWVGLDWIKIALLDPECTIAWVGTEERIKRRIRRKNSGGRRSKRREKRKGRIGRRRKRLTRKKQ